MSCADSHMIVPAIADRYTCRAFNVDGKLTQNILDIALRAAHCAPSSFNSRPWRFWCGQRNTPEWEKLLGVLHERNREFAQNAEWICLVGYATHFHARGKVYENHSPLFDVGAACQNVCVQLTHMGFGSAILGGFDRAEATRLINVQGITPCVVMALGSIDQSVESEKKLRSDLSEFVSYDF